MPVLDPEDLEQIRLLAELEGKDPDHAVQAAITQDRQACSIERVHGATDPDEDYEPEWRPRTKKETRRDCIIAGHIYGCTVSELATLFGLTERAVRKIISKD